MSHRYYWAKIEYLGAPLAAGESLLRSSARNAEKLSAIGLIGLSSSILGEPDGRNF